MSDQGQDVLIGNRNSQILTTPIICYHAGKDYLEEYNKHIEIKINGFVYIVKLPLNLLIASVINKLYPDAKFILFPRHPLDSILSRWMQNFKLNLPMANMLDLDRTVDFYCIALKTFKIFRTNYDLNVHEIRYEDLIDNLKTEPDAVLNFLDLKWESEMENYRATARMRGLIETPSYSQVNEPIYKEAQYRWVNYREYLEPYLKKFKPWISEFRYD